MRFFASFYNSLYNFKWLRDQRQNSSWGWGYFFLLVIFVSGMLTINLGYNYYDNAPELKKQISEVLPEFQAVSANGQLQVSGLTQPYVQHFNQFTIAVNTDATNTIAVKDFVTTSDKMVVLIAKDKLEVYNTQTQEVKTQSVKEFGDFNINRAEVLKNSNILFTNKAVAIVCAIAFVGLFIFLTIVNLLNVLLFGSVVYWIVKTSNKNWKFKEVFTVGLFAITLPMILTPFAPKFIAMIIFAVWVYLAVVKTDKVVPTV